MSDIVGHGQSRGQVSEVDFVALQPGQKVGRYEIVAILGQGGFGITYRARDSQLNREVAIKEYLPSALAVRQGGATVLPRSTKMSEDFSWGRQRFVEEGRTLATLQRAPAIVRVFDFLEDNGTAYIIMELVPGTTLEDRLKGGKTLAAAEVDRILWPLLDGLEKVHATGFLHRDIKPANILLDADGNPTLIDFGASRAAIAGRTTAMTAIFTPGYAAAEQFTSAKQGPWTDVYGISATIYHAIAGVAPPSAFDRMLDDSYRPLAKVMPAGFAPGLLVGIDAGLEVRATDRPQSIAGWRSILTRAGTPDTQATVALAKHEDPMTMGRIAAKPVPAAATPVPPSRGHGRGVWAALAAMILLFAGGGYYFLVAKVPLRDAAAPPVPAQSAAMEAEKAARAEAEELARLRAEKEARDKADAEAAAQRKSEEEAKRKAAAEAEERRRIEEETRQKIEAEIAAKQKAEEETRQKAEEDAAARRKAEEDERRMAETAEGTLHLSPLERQHVQVALTALGFNTNGSDGVFGSHTRDMISAWQKSRSLAATGFLTGTQHQALLRDAAPAIQKFDDEEKKAQEAKKKADEEKAKADAAAKAPPPAPAAPAPATAAATPPAASAAGPDGLWRGSYRCTANRLSGEFTVGLQIRVAGGTGTWVRPGSGPGTKGNQSITLTIAGNQVVVHRVYHSLSHPEAGFVTATMGARLEGNVISGSGSEANSGGRVCDLLLDRTSH
ncbi:protein kinase domain-containing protein [Reyranella sp.]|jgi:serine/threonine protein kinase/peptidoglycan hydrolase-like protein with peptidoglycan-binding domain|uniref:protein kinase domain-containing protein n=1 Tax=Reyranella sp. TaxID=1929291 RepID=UPI002F939BC3